VESSSTSFTARPVGSVGHEILNSDGEIIAWTADDCWAAAIVKLLNDAEGRVPSFSPMQSSSFGAPAATSSRENRPRRGT
jgi:hypothetical protein